MKKSEKNIPAPVFHAESCCLLQRISEGLLLALVILLPLKFASLTLIPEVTAFFPEDWFSYLFCSWPPLVFGCFSGAVLLLTMLAFPIHAPGKVLSFLCVLIVLSLLGFCRASTVDTGAAVMVHLLGLGALTGAAHLTLAADAGFERKLRIALAFAAALAICYGLYQYFWGFAEQQAFFWEYGTANLSHIPSGFAEKVYEERVYSTFGSCNVFGGYLLLLLPHLAICAWRWGLFHSSRALGAGVVAVTLGAGIFLLWRTGSRSAILAETYTAGLAALLLIQSKRWKIVVLCFIVALGSLGAFYFSSRSLESVEERVGYFKTSCKMMARNPLCGSGWGDFFTDHMREKHINDNSEAAHMPHNLLLDFGSQSGVLSMLVLLALLVFPMRNLWGRSKRTHSLEDFCVFFGLLAFLGHAMLDVDFQSLGTMGNLLLFLLLAEQRLEEPQENPFVRRYAMLYGALALCAASSGAYAVTAEKRMDELQQKLRRSDGSFLEVHLACSAVEKMRPFSPFHWLDYGDWLFTRQDYFGALSAYRTALRRAPEHPAIYYRLYQVSAAMGDPRAKLYLQEAAQRFPAEKRYQQELQRSI